jgi:hypothetical protein
MQDFAFCFFRNSLLFARHGQGVFLDFDIKLVSRKPRNGDADAIFVFAQAFDIVRRIRIRLGRTNPMVDR